MIETFYRNPGLTLAAIFLFGMVAGLLLAAWMIYLYWMIERHIARHNSAIREQAALKALEEAAIEIDEDKMLCAVCWEERHPGQQWHFRRRTLCIDHLLHEPGEATTAPANEREYALNP